MLSDVTWSSLLVHKVKQFYATIQTFFQIHSGCCSSGTNVAGFRCRTSQCIATRPVVLHGVSDSASTELAPA